MPHNAHRRRLLIAASSLPLLPCSDAIAALSGSAAYRAQLAALESALDGRLGVHAIDIGSGAELSWRAGERFAFCSTCKLMIAAAMLARDARQPGLLDQRLDYAGHTLHGYSPITARRAAEGMSIGELCAATIAYSDTTAANLLIARLGGPASLTAFARSIGDDAFRLDRIQTELNTALPGDARDTTTPMAMARSLQRLALGDALSPAHRERLCAWLRGNTTGAARIRAGMPAEWTIGDKTGTGDFGTANDVAVIWPPQRAPLILAIYTTRRHAKAKPREDVIAAAARIVADWAGA
ncbi:class A beta-lactamase [Noviherbaspirillum pedocola]|uniref:Beta-lactamase n=1 Tax=Noviherbaspirillum pedocola TaxID=2801341 RepID=A0A934T131_9BURK|nr:class A beta-lactamase [Noviherbaspirillum pedocola]MBK4736649.1 class A beta-lactamase [Noviherbaspirillum pedocola]